MTQTDVRLMRYRAYGLGDTVLVRACDAVIGRGELARDEAKNAVQSYFDLLEHYEPEWQADVRSQRTHDARAVELSRGDS